jgi:hypothetical protein
MQKRPWPLVVAVCAILIVIAGCRTNEQSPPTPAPLVSLSIAPADSSIAPGTTVQFTATGTFADNSKRNVTESVTWDSSDTGIATISNTGLATATMTIGPTVISAISNGITGTTTLATSHVNSITVTPTNPPCIAPGTNQQFSATGTLVDSTVQNLTSFATWTSSDAGVATVGDSLGSKGLATAVSSPGTADIQATYDLKTGSTTLTSSAVASIVTSPSGTSIAKGTTQQFTAVGTLAGNCNTQDVTSLVTWATSSITVATVSDTPGSKGLATAVAVGTATITTTLDSVPSSSATLTVTKEVLKSIEVTTPENQSITSIAFGQTQQFIAIGTFTDTSKQDLTSLVTWNSSNTGVATISNSSGSRGLATSKALGTTTISASFTGITSNVATLTVTQPQLISITVFPASADISIQSSTTKQFTATGTFTDGSTQNLTTLVAWNSSDTGVATISNISGFQGLATVSLIKPLPASTNITATLSGITSNAAILTVTF